MQSTTLIVNSKQKAYRLEVIKTLLRDDSINPKACFEAINKLVNAK